MPASRRAPTRRCVGDWACELDYELVSFSAADRQGVPLYHTNVLMCIGERLAVVGSEAIVPADRDRVLDRLRASGRELLEIGQDAIERFAGNMLELGTWDEALGDSRVLLMSESRAVRSPRGVRAALRVHRRCACGPDPHHREAGRWQRTLHAGRGVPHHHMIALLIKGALSYLLGSLVGSLVLGPTPGSTSASRQR